MLNYQRVCRGGSFPKVRVLQDAASHWAFIIDPSGGFLSQRGIPSHDPLMGFSMTNQRASYGGVPHDYRPPHVNLWQFLHLSECSLTTMTMEPPLTMEPPMFNPFNPGWWFGTSFIFPYIGDNHPNWLIFFQGVETTNQIFNPSQVVISSSMAKPEAVPPTSVRCWRTWGAVPAWSLRPTPCAPTGDLRKIHCLGKVHKTAWRIFLPPKKSAVGKIWAMSHRTFFQGFHHELWLRRSVASAFIAW